MIQEVKDLVKAYYGVSVKARRIKQTSNSEAMNKILFSEVVNILKGVSLKTDMLREEVGIDLAGIEDQYYLAISNLLRMNFTDAQVQLIEYYIYESPSDDEDFEGKIEVRTRNKVDTYTFKTAEGLWDILKFVK